MRLYTACDRDSCLTVSKLCYSEKLILFVRVMNTLILMNIIILLLCLYIFVLVCDVYYVACENTVVREQKKTIKISYFYNVIKYVLLFVMYI